jgi:hypothetical protein
MKPMDWAVLAAFAALMLSIGFAVTMGVLALIKH